jgi:hypothetical protein
MLVWNIQGVDAEHTGCWCGTRRVLGSSIQGVNVEHTECWCGTYRVLDSSIQGITVEHTGCWCGTYRMQMRNPVGEGPLRSFWKATNNIKKILRKYVLRVVTG